ncbi:NusG domain II-containing protein [Eubacterium sp. ER2]|uniref:NusG domain II-containing protein n=1 Tax=Eubacterium sp. ER2 TaxID=1519438 RepID=UPI00051B2437|nr:NusG domain II-containing protein [Eubacterium sp. ER2]HIX99936.1 NusG domain II-containing protein [Candidatus Dorea intestinigallinarum]
MKKHLKIKDIILVVLILLVAGGAWLLHEVLKDAGSGVAVIRVNGEIEGTYPLSEDREISVNGGTNILRIRNGKAKMIEADCPDQLCVNQRAVSADNESIICLPNKVIVEIQSRQESEYDAVTN